ncbi:MAG: zinc ribbon domain-containing protein, partial [Candidatus Helarchaeota archaeon]|nr:zinc ribbon domain-containing protein [Candidatus Helarchaeota archaeon]
PKCGVTGVVNRTISDGDFTKIRLYCPSCQRSFMKVANSSVYNYLMASHYNQMKPKVMQPTAQVFYPSVPSPTMPAYISPPQAAAPVPSMPLPPAPPVPPSPPMTKTCSNCKAPLPKDAVFCRKCGVPVEPGLDRAPRCPFCGATISATARTCPKCSSDLRCTKCNALLSPAAKFCVKCVEVIKGKVEEVKAPKFKCHFCGEGIDENQKVCPACGKPTVCPHCSAILKSSVKFCNKCGANVSEITLAAPEPETEEFEEDLENIEEGEKEGEKVEAKTVTCPKCNISMSGIYNFCTNCGTELKK